VFVGIVVAVIALAVLGRVALAGVGPFSGAVGGVVSDPPNLVVTLTVTDFPGSSTTLSSLIVRAEVSALAGVQSVPRINAIA
jgi:hypothetical protein